MGRDYLYPRGVDGARIVEVIETVACRGDGSNEYPARRVIQYWSRDGRLLGEIDPMDEPQEDC